MTAHQGGYYRFYFTGELDTMAALDSTQYDFDTMPVPATDITFLFDANRTYLDTSTAAEPQVLDIDTPGQGSSFGQFYPNPATSQANIRIDLGNGGNYSVAIIDNLGRTVHTSTLQTAGSIVYTIRTDRLAAGLYTVVFSTNGQTVSRRLVVK